MVEITRENVDLCRHISLYRLSLCIFLIQYCQLNWNVLFACDPPSCDHFVSHQENWIQKEWAQVFSMEMLP